jgi:hypothetical protein
MSKGQWAFRPAVLTRAIKAAEKAGKSRAPTLAGSAVMAAAGPFPRSIRPSGREAVARSEIEGRLSRGPSGNDEGRN